MARSVCLKPVSMETLRLHTFWRSTVPAYSFTVIWVDLRHSATPKNRIRKNSVVCEIIDSRTRGCYLMGDILVREYNLAFTFSILKEYIKCNHNQLLTQVGQKFRFNSMQNLRRNNWVGRVQVDIPKCNRSERFLFQKGYYSEKFYFEGSLFRKVLSRRVIIPKIFIPKGRYSDFRKMTLGDKNLRNDDLEIKKKKKKKKKSRNNNLLE